MEAPTLKELNGKFLDELPHEVIWVGESGNILYANNLFYKRLGYKKEAAGKLSIFDVNPTLTPEAWAHHWGSVRKNRIEHFKETHKTKDGKLYEVEIIAQFFSNNRISFISALVNDFTESSFYRNLLHHAEELTKVGGWKLNLQDGSLVVTEEALRVLNTDNKEEFLPGNIVRRFRNSEGFREHLRKVMREGIPFDTILETEERPCRYLRARAKAIKKGNKVYKIIGAYQDVSDQFEKEISLKLYKEIIDNAQDLVYVYNREGKLVHYSNSVSEYLGFSRAELDQFTIFDLDPSITPQWWDSHMNEIAAKKVLRFEWIVSRKDGTKFQADITANYLKYRDEDLNCAIVRDITDRKIRESELFKALNEIATLKNQLEQENEYLQTEIKRDINFDSIICTSESYAQVLKQVEKVANTNTTVLITGESGTGKELLANSIHQNSARKNRPLIKINAATLPRELIESELFGHKKGAFTGATADKVGKFSLADGGTIFLDEIGEMPLELQPKLLRVLQEGELDPLGSTKTIKVDVRVIAATNRDLEQMVRNGEFREDLFYRLNVFPIHNIPLRERREDIPMLAQYFLEKYSARAGKSFNKISKRTLEALNQYSFPGNIRELENLIERAVILEEGTTLFPGDWLPKKSIASASEHTFKTFEEAQKEHIIKVLKRTGGKVSGPNGAAQILDMNDKTLYARMKRLGIERKTIYS